MLLINLVRNLLNKRFNNLLGLKTLEGYLEKKSAGFTKAWEKRYFAIKNAKMYWYNNDRAREALNSLDVKGIRRCNAVKENKFELVNIVQAIVLIILGL